MQIQERYGIDLAGVPYVGDSLRDMEAAQAAGCAPHLVLTGRHPDMQGQALPPNFPVNTRVHTDLAAFVEKHGMPVVSLEPANIVGYHWVDVGLVSWQHLDEVAPLEKQPYSPHHSQAKKVPNRTIQGCLPQKLWWWQDLESRWKRDVQRE